MDQKVQFNGNKSCMSSAKIFKNNNASQNTVSLQTFLFQGDSIKTLFSISFR
jgi:hypothetical protein